MTNNKTSLTLTTKNVILVSSYLFIAAFAAIYFIPYVNMSVSLSSYIKNSFNVKLQDKHHVATVVIKSMIVK